MGGTRKKRWASAVLGASLLAAACSPGYPRPLLWRNFTPHTEAMLVPAAATPGCPRVGPQNLSGEEQRILLAARAEVCAIIASPEFKREVTSRTWLATCRKGARPDTISGDRVYALYTTEVGPFSVRFRKPVNAEASTQILLDRMAIRRNRLEAWRIDGGARKGALINTLAHEMTHLVPTSDPRNPFRFQDDGHRKRERPALELVSYGIGDLIERLWRLKSGFPAPQSPKVESC